MYDNLEDALTYRRFIPTPRPYPSSRLHEHYAVEPWEKNTMEMEIEIKEEIPRKQIKTFYQVGKSRIGERHYTTHRGFGFKGGVGERRSREGRNQELRM